MDTLLGKDQPELDDRFLYWEYFESGIQQAVRWRNWKAIRFEKDGPLEIYDVVGDPGEERNVAAGESQVVLRFTNYLKTARTESAAWPVTKSKAAN